jgi:hypothetical protein
VGGYHPAARAGPRSMANAGQPEPSVLERVGPRQPIGSLRRARPVGASAPPRRREGASAQPGSGRRPGHCRSRPLLLQTCGHGSRRPSRSPTLPPHLRRTRAATGAGVVVPRRTPPRPWARRLTRANPARFPPRCSPRRPPRCAARPLPTRRGGGRWALLPQSPGVGPGRRPPRVTPPIPRPPSPHRPTAPRAPPPGTTPPTPRAAAA